MLRYDNFHSALVAWLKVLLPLIALGILSTLFLVTRTIDPENAIPFAEVDLDERAREPRLTQPTWAGVTEDGASLTVHATEARPGAEGGADPTAKTVRARLETPGGGRTDIAAASATLNEARHEVTLSGGVTIITSTGYAVETPGLRARLDRTGAESEGPVTGTGPAGKIAAGGLRITADPQAEGSYQLVFDKGVRLVYDPAR
jgi:lipopolysaccharide export system protein LptC